MKKSLIALAVAGAFAAPAFAATENVDVYGKLHMSVSVFDDQEEGTPGEIQDGASDVQFSSNASRIGFKGAEDLGGGLSAIWQIESGVNLDEQNGSLASRNSFVGLKGGFGTALIGNHDTPFKLVGRAVDLFGDTIADSRNIMGGGSFNIGDVDLSLTSDMRADNVVAYISPSFSGFTFSAAYTTDPVSSGTAAPDVEDSDVFSVSGTYANGPLFLGLGYSDGDGLENSLGQDSNLRVAGGFTFGNAKIVGQYDTYEDASNVGNDFDAWMVGGSYTMGNIVLKANYIEGEFDEVDADIDQFAIGADYNLSKRTTVYALYVGATNTALGWGAGSSDVNIPNDWTALGGTNEDISALSVGVTHSF